MKLAIIVCALAVVLAQVAMCADNGVTSPPTYQVGCPIPDKRVAVMNLSVGGPYSDQVAGWLPAMIEDRLLRQGWTLLVRDQRMQHVQNEQNMPGIKPGTRPVSNELLGATALLELNCRTQVKDIQGTIGYKIFSIGDFARASVDLNGQIVDPATGVLKSSIIASGSASGLKTALAATIASNWRIGAVGYNLEGIRESLVGKAADSAVTQMVARLCALYPSLPAQPVASANKIPETPTPGGSPMQPSSTTITAAAAPATILVTLSDKSSAKAGDRYGVYRGELLVAELEIIKLAGIRAEARVVSQTSAIRATDVARKMPMEIKAE